METMEKSERAHFFTAKEQQLIIESYGVERPVLTAKSNTFRASKMREAAWQRIADKLNKQSGSGYKRTWQQVKIKHKNLLQTANRKKADLRRDDMGPANVVIKSDDSEEEFLVQQSYCGPMVEGIPGGTSSEPHTLKPSLCQQPTGKKLTLGETNVVIKSDDFDEEFLVQQSPIRPMVEGIPGGTSSEPAAAYSSSSFISVTGHSLTLLPPPQSDPEHSVCDETFSTETRLDEDFDPSSAHEKGRATGKKTAEQGQTEDIKTLYRRYLIQEMENREQEMAYRALKMRKVEKEIQLLDRQLEKP